MTIFGQKLTFALNYMIDSTVHEGDLLADSLLNSVTVSYPVDWRRGISVDVACRSLPMPNPVVEGL